MPLLSRLLLLFVLLLTVTTPAQGVPPPSVAPLSTQTPVAAPSSLATLWETPIPTPALLHALQESTTADLAALPKESKEESIEQQRALLQKRISLLQEFLETVERLQALQAASANRRTQEEALKKTLDQIALQPPPKTPDKPTPEAFKQAQEALEKANQTVESLTAQAKERQLLLGQIPEKTLATKERLRQAKEGAQQSQELATKAEGNKKRPLTLQAENARIDGQIAQALLTRWEAEQNSAMDGVTLQDKQLEIAQATLQYQQRAFALYQGALNNQQAATLTVRQEALRLKEQAAQQASSPEQKFLTYWDLEIARLQKNGADLNKLHTDIVSVSSEQEHLLQNEQDELKNLQALTKQFGTQGLAAEILKDNFKRLARRRWELREPPRPELLQRVTELQPRLYIIDSALAELNASWAAAMAEIQTHLPVVQKEAFAQQTTQMRNTYRQLLIEEKHLLFDLQADGQRLKLLTLERTGTLDAMETFLLARVFWIQDALPLGMTLLQQLSDELFSSRPNALLHIWRHVGDPEQTAYEWDAVRLSVLLLAGIVLFFLLPPSLWWINQQLRHLLKQTPDHSTEGHKPDVLSSEAVLATLLRPILGPLYLLVLVLAAHLLPLPTATVALVQGLFQDGLLLLAAFWFLWAANRQLLTPDGLAKQFLRLPNDVIQSLARSIEISLVAYLIFLPAWFIFRAPPFLYEALPRLGYTLFECAAAYALYRLIRHDAPLPRHAFAHAAPSDEQNPELPVKQSSAALLSKHWRGISWLLSLFMAVVVVLDVAGYHFGASWLAYNGIRTVMTFFLLIGLYRALSSTVERLVRRRRRKPTVLAPGDRGSVSRGQMVRQINASLRRVFILGGLVLLSNYWGIHEQLFQVLKGWTLYNTTGSDGQLVLVTLVDFVRFLLTLLVISWLVKHLPRIYELVVFSWLSLDAGSRYAVLTISRYLIAIVGLLSALNELHLDIAKIGWLVAAISVGIGFGLQEIVANFVSGIILLLERPIRVGDWITIGSTITGRVTRINIRATTVLNTDYQEQLVPNRDLITKEVTNWTLANTTLRIVIPIGVAYGSDIEQVKGILLALARQQPEILTDPPADALFVQHGASSLDFELRVCLPDPGLRWIMRDRLNTAINHAFTAQGIEIPFPQREVWVRNRPE
ncbi:MAG: mechanosensitive ion channel [Magnetococcales bacterium]|nr:mechanosensitive ion channel [Magnetococcales bacterium]